MAADIHAIIRDLESFYDFTGKSVIHVGAGGGQLVAYAHRARSVTAVDPDPAAVDRLEAALRAAGLADRFQVVNGRFEAVTAPADIVFFEFCLHEIDDPAAALAHARTLAPDIVVIDHVPDSPWVWLMDEEGKLTRSWGAVGRAPVNREASFEGLQRFNVFQELHTKLQSLGEPTLTRIQKYQDCRDFTIGMDYQIALIHG